LGQKFLDGDSGFDLGLGSVVDYRFLVGSLMMRRAYPAIKRNDEAYGIAVKAFGV
jgi:hypothetical protein